MAMEIAAIIVAAGRGTRAGGDVPKQWQRLHGARVADWTVAAFLAHARVGRVVLVLHPDDLGQAEGFADVIVATGGATRDASVAAGLEALAADPPDRVLIHDVARPLVSAAVIDRVAAAYPEAEQDRLDGLTVDRGEWWFNLRPSNTEPLLRLNLEAPTTDDVDTHVAEVRNLLTAGAS